jgi:hypothetical protein
MDTSLTDNSGNAQVILQLSELLLANVSSPSYKLTKDQINWINQFIAASPDSFKQIDNDLAVIVASGQIGLHTIPQLVHLFADIYINGALKVGVSNPANIIAFVRFTIDMILESKYLILPDIEKELIRQLVDTSLNLLAMNIVPIQSEIVKLESNPFCIGFFSCVK